MSADDFLGMKSGSAWSRGNDELGGLPAPVSKQGPVDTLVYPLDVGTQQFYPESIKFTVYERQSSSLDEVEKAFKQAGGEMIDRWLKIYEGDEGANIAEKQKIEKRMEEIAKRKKEMGEKAMFEKLADWMGRVYDDSFLNDIGSFISKASPSLAAGLNQTIIEKANILDYIYLNMPNEISFAEPVGWEGTDLGLVGGLAKFGENSMQAGTVSNFGNMMGAGGGALAGLLGKAFGGIPGLNMMSGAILGSLGGGAAQKALESSFANIGNPYKEMTFSGIGFREFSFNFVFRARNHTEAKTIQDIIEKFRYYSKPTFQSGMSILNYPQEFLIEFLTKPENKKGKTTLDRFETNPYIPQIKMCVCKGVNTNFTSQNTWRALKTGAPVEIALQLQFEETELVTADDVIGNTKVGRFKKQKGKF